MSKLLFPQDFLWGSSTAAHQVEGNNTNSDWWQWEHSAKRAVDLQKQNKNPEEYYSGIACDSYHRYEEDFDLLSKLNQNAHRLSIEWARVQPTADKFDVDAIAHYRKVLQALERRGITTFVTLHHFTNPIWFAEIGGWEKIQNITFFIKYAEKIAAELGDLIDFICVINEPNVYAGHAYLEGAWPPQTRNLILSSTVLLTMREAHVAVYKSLKAKYPRIQIGTAYHVHKIEAIGILKPFVNTIENILYKKMLKGLAKFSDFIGIQYYRRRIIAANSKYPFVHDMPLPSDAVVTDMGWEIYAQGLYDILLELAPLDKPIYITENGVADSKDALRTYYIKEHLHAIHQAIQHGAPIKGYLHWSLLDNFEWDSAYAMKFGLVEIDRQNNLKRTPRLSASVYAEICKENALEIEDKP